MDSGTTDLHIEEEWQTTAPRYSNLDGQVAPRGNQAHPAKPTTSHSLARILMGFVLNGGAIPPCGKWNKPGQEPNGRLKEISRDASID